MFLATAVVTVVLAAVLVWAAVRKLTHQERVVQSYLRVGVPEDKLNYLAAVLFAGAGGLVAGLWWAPIGIAAAIGVVCYFVGAVVFHVRANDTRNLLMPIGFLVIAVVALVLRFASS